jgi:hypothetical protein
MPVLNDAAPAYFGHFGAERIDMGTVIAFPSAARRLDSPGLAVPRKAQRKAQAKVLILPVVRIERHGETTDGGGPEQGAAAGRRRRRRARS